MKRFAKTVICAVCIASFLMSPVPFGNAFTNDVDPGADNHEIVNGRNWMSGISGERYLYEINIPGTHDSTTAYCKNSTGDFVKIFGIPAVNSGSYAKTQSLTIPEQLNAGIRYLDLRFSPKQDKLLLCHGNNEKITAVNKAAEILTVLNPLLLLLKYFDIPFISLDMEFYTYEDEDCTVNITGESVLEQVKTFLRENPSETVIITAKKENGESEEFLRLFKELIDKLKSEINPSTQEEYLYTENGSGIYTKMPTLSDLRGKIVLMTPFYKELQVGDMLDVKNGAGQTDFMGMTFNYENHWSVTGNLKAFYTERFIDDYSTEMSRDPGRHLNCANVLKTNSSAVLIQTPYEIEKKVNETLYSQGSFVKGRYYGWIMGDFMTEEKCSAIWQTNYFVFDN